MYGVHICMGKLANAAIVHIPGVPQLGHNTDNKILITGVVKVGHITKFSHADMGLNLPYVDQYSFLYP